MNSPNNMQSALELSGEEFNRILEEIDGHLTSQGRKIPGRELLGWGLFCIRQGLSDVPMSHPISQKVMAWFKARYGDRLNLDLDFGHSVLLIRGDILRFRCPRFYGRAYVLCCAELMNRDFSEVMVRRPSLMNVLGLISGMTQTYFSSLTPAERDFLLESFSRSEILLARISDVDTPNFVEEARADIRMSVEQMTLPNPQFGPSKYASLQAVEKFLKAYISQKGSKPEWSHVLSELAATAESLGLRTVDKPSLELVQCSASVRYQSSLVTKEEAVSAHQAAILICANIATQLAEQSGWKTIERGRALLTLEGIQDKIPAILISRSK
jgi:HEPN domain-containing protein